MGCHLRDRYRENKMKEIILMAETGSDIPQQTADELGIYIVPMHVSFGTETKDDGTFPAEDIVSYYEQTGTLPKTSGCMPNDFETAFDAVHAAHPDAHILYLAYSAVTTCSYQSAMIAGEGRDYITYIDTKHVSVGQYVVVTQMAKWLKEHPWCSPKEAADAAVELAARVRMCFLPDQLEFLRAGGRVSNAAAMAGTLLRLHPRIDIVDGYLKASKKYRGKMAKILTDVIQDAVRDGHLSKEELWLIWSPGFSDENKRIAEDEVKRLGFKKFSWVKTGGVITTHGGPGCLGVVGISE